MRGKLVFQVPYHSGTLDNEQGRILSAVVNSVSLKRNICLCVWESADKKIRKLYFATDIQKKLKRLLTITEHVFKSNFAIAMGKQFTGLTDCQSCDLNKLHFHFNASLTSINQAKVKAIEKGTALSIASVKVLCHNIFLMQRFISVLGIKPNEEINRRLWKEESGLQQLLHKC